MGLPKPDLVLFLQLQLAEAAARGEFGLERYESRAFQEQALERFQQLMSDTSLNWKVGAGTLGSAPDRPLEGTPSSTSASSIWTAGL